MKLEKILQGKFRDFAADYKHRITTCELSKTNFDLGEKLRSDFLGIIYKLGIEEAYAISRTTGDAAAFTPSYEGPLDYVASGFIFNAVDSLTERWVNDLNFQAYLRLTIDRDESLKSIKVEVEDNGTGIRKGDDIFVAKYGSKKDYSVMHGYEGFHLYNSQVLIEALGGAIGFINKGMNKGAIFWYEVPLASLAI